ncbi:MAG: 30S ribosomal protein S5 [Patescibacteria group bacterium]
MRPKAAPAKREAKEYDERVIEVQRVSRVVKGGRRIRFRALVAIGDRRGKVGMGVAKAGEVAEAVRKAVAQAKKHLIEVPIIDGTIPHEVIAKFGSARVMLKPASSGTTIVAGGSVRVVAELAGVENLLSKIMGSSNKINNVSATLKAFSSFNTQVVERLRKYNDRPEIKSVTVEKEEAALAPEQPAPVSPVKAAPKKKVAKKEDVAPAEASEPVSK